MRKNSKKQICFQDITEDKLSQCRELIHEEVRRLTEKRTKEDIDKTVAQIYQLPAFAKKCQTTSSAMGSAMNSAIHSAMHSAMYSAMDPAMRSAMDSAIHSVIDSGMRSALRSAMDPAIKSSSLKNGFYCSIFWRYWSVWYRLGETLGVNFSKVPYVSFFHDFCRNCSVGIWFSNFCFVFPNCEIVEMHQIGETKDMFKFPIYELHKDGGPSLKLFDIECYHWHNVLMPKKYGSVHSSKWKPEWFISEENLEIRRILAEQIGYEKIFQALDAKKVDTYLDYTLWRAESVDVEPVVILQMKCPSTGKLHYGRVPSYVRSAKQAVALRNFGVPFEQFGQQT